MPTAKRVLVVANRTVDSEELLSALIERCAHESCSFTLLAPASWEVQDPRGGRQSVQRRLRRATARLRGAGVEVACTLGDPDPVVAVEQTWDPDRFDEVVVSTLPTRLSKWLRLDLPRRVERITGAPVTHVVATERDPAGEPSGTPAA